VGKPTAKPGKFQSETNHGLETLTLSLCTDIREKVPINSELGGGTQEVCHAGGEDDNEEV
jgi:hypothetical protein